MSRTSFMSPFILAALLAAIVNVGCGDVPRSVTGAEVVDVALDTSCPGHPSCRDDPPAPAGDATIDLTGDMTTVSSQDVVLSKDSKNHLPGSGAGVDLSIVDALALLAAAGDINQSWLDDGDGNPYRTRISGAAVTSPAHDVYAFTGGDTVSWDTSTNEELIA